MKEELSITRNKVITLQYALSNADGVIIREASGAPITYLHGAGGKITGTDEQGNEVTFIATEIRDDIVYMDGNHPLAGQSLHFEVEIQGIRDATEEEIRSGKAIT